MRQSIRSFILIGIAILSLLLIVLYHIVEAMSSVLMKPVEALDRNRQMKQFTAKAIDNRLFCDKMEKTISEPPEKEYM